MKDIDEVKKDIDKVKKKIDGVEEDISNCNDPDEKAQLQAREDRLSAKEEQLHEKDLILLNAKYPSTGTVSDVLNCDACDPPSTIDVLCIDELYFYNVQQQLLCCSHHRTVMCHLSESLLLWVIQSEQFSFHLY